jgi:AhpC/TSA family
LHRRAFLIAASAPLALAAPVVTPATILFGENTVALDTTRVVDDNLWIKQKDLPRINQFEVKPQGACRADVCIPLSKTLKTGEWFNLTGFARKIGETVVSEQNVHSFGEIPVLRGAFYNSRMAPDFSVPNRQGKPVHLSDFRGKKVLVVTWASW